MKKLIEPPMPVTFWPHALLQMLVFVVYVLALESMGIFPTLQTRLGELESSVGWWLPFVIWILYVFLLGEIITRVTQRWASNVFPDQRWPFIFLSIMLALPLMFTVFVAWECLLFFVAMGRFPLNYGRIGIFEAFGKSLRADAPFLLVLLLGELLRHWIYAGWIRKWHHERGLRILPAPEEQEEV
jgi:hypothetical protein